VHRLLYRGLRGRFTLRQPPRGTRGKEDPNDVSVAQRQFRLRNALLVNVISK